jgi:hypothetical protein
MHPGNRRTGNFQKVAAGCQAFGISRDPARVRRKAAFLDLASDDDAQPREREDQGACEKSEE